jgi:hypothetical protein
LGVEDKDQVASHVEKKADGRRGAAP